MNKRKLKFISLFFVALLIITYILNHKLVNNKNILNIGVFSGNIWDVPIVQGYTLYGGAVESFENLNPSVNIFYRSGTLKEDYSEWLSQKFILNEEPDVFLLFNSDFNTFVSSGALLNLSNLINSDSDFDINEFYSTAAELGLHNGDYYALPMELNPMVMGVNLDLLEREGISLPNEDLTWDEFKSICEKVSLDKNEDGIIDQFGCVGYDWREAINTNSINLFDIEKKKGLFTSPEVLNAVNSVKELNSLNGGQKVTVEDFEKGNVAFIVFPFSEYLSYSRYPYKIIRSIDFNWKCIKLPITERNSAGTCQSLLVSISAKCKNKSLAWKFVKHLVYSEEVQSNIYEHSFGVPVIKRIAESEEAVENLKKQIPDKNFMINTKVVSSIIESSHMPPYFSNYDKAMDIADKELYQALDNGSNIEKTLQGLNIKINDILND